MKKILQAGIGMEKVFVYSSDLSSILSCPGDVLPIYSMEGDLHSAEGETISHHWHSDLEYIYLKEGKADFFVNGKTVTLLAGQGLFINSRCLHHAHEYTDCLAIIIRIHPSIFTANYKQGADYYARKFARGEPNYVFLDPQIPWNKQIIDGIINLRECDLTVEDHPLSLLIAAYTLIELIGEHIKETAFSEKDNQDYRVYLEMVKYIHDNYNKKVNIDDMAQELHLSRTKAYRLFDKYAHTSPNNYLNTYRLAMSQQALRDTDLTITEISTMCGFQTSSYFTKIFGKETGTSPRAYRERHKSRRT